ncbi:hypothetical protein PN497_24290 [Sphaerospermopsis kisseleviana CS-549]|uniref:Uncharacterized protein n=1 Tax=Sphaerospermopsis kisseleviana CS-549 TaxID=3021783 RepID=A0ABT4ZZC7_9CYAN|nr:hypothetical protein [Sphaerospermopsis kisseleviana]MDB9444446.1 hypothetical protein [Sphaerospermopsis kisseleviana CS-549]BAZ78831.1 hypothetical protein NIES73_00670 [Sphaerospermopsis kisseleviana NIES-73]
MAKIILNLLDNGLDYIYVAVRPIFIKHDSSQHSWKYSVLHLYSGIELLLKEKLKQEHWSLIFQDISSADSKKFENGEFISVYHDELVKRLRGISKVTINDEPIKKLRDLRNRFEHFEVNISLSECEEIVVAALDEIIKFWENNLKSISTVEQQKTFETIKSIVTGFETYRQYRLRQFQQAIDGINENKNGLIVSCPDCGSLSFAVFKNVEKECKCFVCDTKYRKEDYLKSIREYEERRDKKSFVPYEKYDINCPSCKKETRVRYRISDDITFYCCLSCLHVEKISQEEQTKLEMKEWVKNLEKTHTTEEIIKILEEKVKELDNTIPS